MKMTRRQVLVGGGAVLASAAVGHTGTGRDGFDLNRITLEVDALDEAHDGLRIAQLSDLHIGHMTPSERIRAAVRTVNAEQPDLVVLTGDYVTNDWDPLERVPELLKGLEAPTLAVLGNHDYWTDAKKIGGDLEKCGYAVLRNEHTVLRVRGQELRIIGVDDGRTRRDDVTEALRGVPASGTRIVLAHTPSTAKKLPNELGAACFSGHTHGGHFVVPGITAAILRSHGEPFVRGRYEVDRNVLWVNRGLGYGRGSPVPRVGAEPEVTLATLRRRRT